LWKCLLLAGLAGILTFASFPRLNQGYLAWTALVPLLLAINLAPGPGVAFASGLAAGLVQWSGLLAWIPPVMVRYGGLPLIPAWLLLVSLASLLAAYSAIACAITRYCTSYGRHNRLLVFPFIWVTLEAFRTYFIFDGFPWLLAGYSQTEWLALVQISDVTGVFGISFLVAWINAALAFLIIRRGRVFTGLWPLGLGTAMLAGCIWYGHNSLKEWRTTGAPFKAAMLQGNLAFEESQSVLAWKFQQGYLQMADQMKGAPVDLMVLPEAPAALSFQFDADYRRAMESLARRTSLGLVLNNVHYLQATEATHYYNSAYFIGSDGQVRGRYDKMHLVPFGEYIPLKSVFFFVQTISKDVSAFSPGDELRVVDLGNHRLSAIICFEAIFPQLSRRFARLGSQLFVNLTNDGWYGDSGAPYQHLQMARWRAIEGRRFLLRATNSGISAVVEPTGRIQASTTLLREAVCLGNFAFLDTETFYSRHGDVFAALCAIISTVTIATCGWRRIKS
jgi:apolipoprotein N-acyltransferase